MTGFDIIDRYDILAIVVFGGLMFASLAMGAPLWATALIVLVVNIGVFVRHFDQLTGG